MKALKTLVFFMTALLVGGLALLGWGLATKAHRKLTGTSSQEHGFVAPSDEFGTVSVPLPAGAHVEQMTVAGDKVVLRVAASGGEQVVVLDPFTGKVNGSFVLAPGAAPAPSSAPASGR